MRKRTGWYLVSALIILGSLALMAYWLPPLNSRLSWRLDVVRTYLRGVLNPVEALPTAMPRPRVQVTRQPTGAPELALALEATLTSGPPPTPVASPTPTLSPTPIPDSIMLAAPAWEKQDANNCGPTSLAMYLRSYGWEGDQFTISDLLKPRREDRNVNIEELAYYVRNHAGWLSNLYRVGGNLELLKKLLAAGLPVLVEEGTQLDATYWPNDDRWAAHYLLLTGYDDSRQVFIGQDSYYGADQEIPYPKLDKQWQAFNRVYFLLYPPEREAEVQSILGPYWDEAHSREHALQVAQDEAVTDPQDAFAWFNLGTNLGYFDRYSEAADAYDVARNLGLPQRMLRYQFGPFMAYFHSNQLEDLAALIDYALQRTPNSEEAMLWRGWSSYRQGDTNLAVEDFRQALVENPNYQDAQYALDYILND